MSRVYYQVDGQLKELKAVRVKSSSEDGVNGGYYTPTASQSDPKAFRDERVTAVEAKLDGMTAAYKEGVNNA